MRARSITVAVTSLVLAAAVLGCSATCPQAPAETAAPAPRSTNLQPASGEARAKTPPEQRHVYRLEFAVSASDGGKPASSSAYTLNVEEDRGGELHIGSNVPLQTNVSPGGAAPRQDVGLKIRCSFTSAGDDLLLHTSVEMSSVDDPPPERDRVREPSAALAIRKISTAGDAVVSPSKPALVNSLEDPITHRRYQVTATATKLR